MQGVTSGKIFLIYLITSVTFISFVYTQEDNKKEKSYSLNLLETNFGISKLMTGYTSLYTVPSYFYELRFAKLTDGYRSWQVYYGFPEIGISFLYGNFGNTNIFGHTYGIIPDLTLNTLSNKPFSVKVKLGLGLGYFNKPYDIIENPENTYIGSRIANISHASFTLQQKIVYNLFIQYGINYYHCSNGHYQVPNEGMNLPGFIVGIRYYPAGKMVSGYNIIEDNKVVLKWKFGIRCGMGVHEFAGTLGPVGGPKYRINTMDVFFTRPVGKIVNISSGIAVKYYTDYYEFADKYDFFSSNKKWNATVTSLFIGNEFLLYKIGVFVQTGIDIYAPFEKKYLEYKDKKIDFKCLIENFVSSKIGVNYYIFDPKSDRFMVPYFGIFLKTNFGMADFIGTHIGFLFGS